MPRSCLANCVFCTESAQKGANCTFGRKLTCSTRGLELEVVVVSILLLAKKMQIAHSVSAHLESCTYLTQKSLAVHGFCQPTLKVKNCRQCISFWVALC